MAGLLNYGAANSPVSQGAKQQSKIANPELQSIEDGIEAKVPPELKNKYNSIVVAGMRIMFDKSTSKYLEDHLASSQDVVKTISTDIPKLLLLIYRESKIDRSNDENQKVQFIGAAMLAGRTLMCQALDYAEKTGRVQVTTEIIDQCTAALSVSMPAAFGITKEMMAKQVGVQGGAPDAQAASQEPPMGQPAPAQGV